MTPERRNRGSKLSLFRRSIGLLVLAAAIIYTIALLLVLVVSQQDQRAPSDAIVVLGAAQYDGRPSPVYRARLDHAADLYERDLAPTILVTGGRRPGDRFTEAAAGEGYLMGLGG